MVSAIGTQHRHTPEIVRPEKTDKEERPEGMSGKSADSVGHRAKLMVAESDDTTAGAQGRAASLIARMDITVLAPELPADQPATEPAATDDGSSEGTATE